MADNSPLIVCLASYFKGVEFMREAQARGARVVLVTKERCRDEEWAHDALEASIALPNDATPETYVQTVAGIARRNRVKRVVALEEFDVITAGLVREHLRLPGMTSSHARLFRDKLAMRVAARDAGVNVPEFVHLLNFQEVGEFLERVPAPWVLKPRTDVSAIGIRKIDDAEQVWRAMDALDARERPHERASFHLLERFVAGEVFHVDSVVYEGEVRFAGVNRYGRPPMKVAQEGGAFISSTVGYDTEERAALLDINRRVVAALGLRRGAAHAEFIKGADDGRLYFLEIAARVGGAFTAENLEAASGVNVWREWAKIELADDEYAYEAPAPRRGYSGIILSLARQEYPDTSHFTDPEIVFRPRKRHHVALVVRSEDPARVGDLLEDYARRFAAEFIAVAPPLERAE
ncbi:MAG: ATP-grasp domain-containing protein [Acidobacteria bacterium]|nr:ATP-grasp domain-containing protein [Acidobacteriota bacterium]MCA1640921.1 ATP-grasp domain-containing protein [Acidobacteriota bacterium]